MNQPHFLNNVFRSSDFSQQELKAILPAFEQVAFIKNDFLLREGSTEQYYWFIESGYIRSFVIDTEGNDITTHFFSTGEIAIDWPSFFLRNPSQENIQALTDCICWQLDFSTFQQLFHSIETFREQGRKRLVSAYFSLKQHNVSMIADQAKDRYLKLLSERPHILQHVSLKHIATYLGITDTSLSRIRKEISRE